MKIEALAPPSTSTVDGIRMLVLTAESQVEELELAQLFRSIKNNGAVSLAMERHDAKEPGK